MAKDGASQPPKQRQPAAAGGGTSATTRGGAKWPIVRFVALFIVMMSAFYVATSVAWYRDGLFPRYLELNASASATMLNLLGEDARAGGSEVISPRMALSIRAGCDAIEPSAMFTAAVLAFPSAVSLKLTGLLIGVPILLGLNLARIISLYYVGVHAPQWFATAHVDLWQPLFILLALTCWLVWAVWTVRRTAQEAES